MNLNIQNNDVEPYCEESDEEYSESSDVKNTNEEVYNLTKIAHYEAE